MQFTAIAVAGTGPAGLATALALLDAGLEVAIFGPRPFADTARPDTRTAALLAPSIAFLESLGVWGACAPHAAPLKRLVISDQTGRLLRAPDVSFSAAEIGAEAFGYNIPNRALVAALHQAVAARAGVWHETAAVADIRHTGAGVEIETAEGGRFGARLLVGADGRESLSRARAGIEARRWDYGHTAVVCSFTHEAPHNDTCIELHRSAGPLTVVPLPGNCSSLVWVERPDEAARLMDLNDAAFAAELEAKMGAALGAISEVGQRTAFPLSSLAVARFGARRTALVGEAAHVIPPIGAQGLNLGFRDAADLVRILSERRDASGFDPGSEGVLAAYTAARRGDVWTRTLAADLLNRTLISGFMPFDLARSVGLGALTVGGALKRFLMRQGMGPSRTTGARA